MNCLSLAKFVLATSPTAKSISRLPLAMEFPVAWVDVPVGFVDPGEVQGLHVRAPPLPVQFCPPAAMKLACVDPALMSPLT
jgi:hypothetical protein